MRLLSHGVLEATPLPTSRPRSSSPGGGWGGEPEEEEDTVDELDPNVLNGFYLAGERFDRMVKRVVSPEIGG
jgi:hypothetical protein